MQTKIIKISPTDSDFEEKISEAAEVIKNGGLVVFPTETVYGLGADATSSEAAARIFAAKGRPSDNPLIIHIAKPEQAEEYTYTNDTYYKLAKSFMPGPLTVVLPSKDSIPRATRGGLSTVAVRCPENKIASALISASERPIAAPSANLSGTPSPTKATHVIDDMMGRVDMIIDGGDSEFGLESTIVKIEDDGSLTLLRPGKITVDDLRGLSLNVIIADAVIDRLKDGEIALSPGMKYRHYAPKAPLVLIDGDTESTIEYIRREALAKTAVIAYEGDVERFEAALPKVFCYAFGKRGDEIAQAHMLFSILRDADKENYDKIYAPLPSERGVGLALYNRMIRAAAHKIIKL